MKTSAVYNRFRKAINLIVSLVCTIRWVLVLFFLTSCASSRDIYNPGVSRPQQPGNHRELYAHAQNVNRPDWIYATASDFIVGHGEDTSISGARNKALDNIKLVIGKALPQHVEFSETTAAGNRGTNRQDVQSESAYIFIQRISNVFDLKLSLDFNNILDYHHEIRGNTYTYYVKYRICQSEIEKITQKLEEQKRKRENLIDSLVSIDTLSIVESIVDRHHYINLLLQTFINITERDSMRLSNTMQRIETLLHQLEIRDISETDGKLLLDIRGSGRTFKTNIKPAIYHDDRVVIEDVYFENGLWIINYSISKLFYRKSYLDIEFNYPGFILEYYTTLDNSLHEKVKGGIEISNPRLELLSKNPRSGNITKMQFFMNISSESFATLNIEDITLEIVSAVGPALLLTLKDHNLKQIMNGYYSFSALIADCNIPVRFLRQVRHANIKLQIVIDEKPELKEMLYKPITIRL